MAHDYIPVDRDQPFLLPPDMRDWLPEGHLVWFVIDVVSKIDTSVLHATHPKDGVGRRAYNPDMLLALLIYAYCTGQRSSRQIERLCEVDVAYRVIAANRAPDHTTIARFRQDHDDIAVSLFSDVLVLCAAAGLANVGLVAVDGTKMGTDASLSANRSRAQIEAEVRAMLKEAADTDAAQDRLFGDTRGDELPPELADPRRRGARLDAALRELEVQERARREADDKAREARAEAEAKASATSQGTAGRWPHEAEVARAEAALARAEQRSAVRYAQRMAARAPGRTGPVPKEEDAPVARAKARLDKARADHVARAARAAADKPAEEVNTTDPESRIMKTKDGWLQGYNGQAAVNENGVVVACSVTQDANDVGQLQPMIVLLQAMVMMAGIDASIGVLLFDAGYWSEGNANAEGPDRLIATTKSHRLRTKLKDEGPRVGSPPEGATAAEAMEHRLLTEEGAALYSRRSVTVEPVFGQHKDGRGFRRFVRRGLQAADAEWILINATHNILKVFRSGWQIT